MMQISLDAAIRIIKTLNDRIKELEGDLDEYHEANHFGDYGPVCACTGQFDAGLCWKCQLEEAHEEIKRLKIIQAALGRSLNEKDNNDPACPYCKRPIVRGSTIRYYNKQVYHSGCLDATGHTVDAQPEDTALLK